MWDLTPDTDLLKELPQTYSFETALADLIVSFSIKLPENDKILSVFCCEKLLITEGFCCSEKDKIFSVFIRLVQDHCN